MILMQPWDFVLFVSETFRGYSYTGTSFIHRPESQGNDAKVPLLPIVISNYIELLYSA